MKTTEEAFDAFASEVAPGLMRSAYLLTGNRADSEELVQETLMTVFLRWKRISEVEHPRAYALTVLVNKNKRRFRRRRVTELLSDAVPDTVSIDSSHVEDRQAVAQLLAHLTPKQREVIVLRYCEDLSELEVATLLGCPIGTVKSHASRGLATLRAHTTDRSGVTP
jgi:RNA polymerase sigma-70 factor (sigma-E family)